MLRFYFHFRSTAEFTRDDEGLELRDEAAARHIAIRALRDTIAADVRAGVIDTSSSIEIEDELHNKVMTIAFADAVGVDRERFGALG